ncbi:5-taurinomethyluridine-[tRNA] synthase subunit GTPB3, mitochondrial [Lycorma delicatula]|uniref:5-taurinomethyluridine-[tRNA] synthase subunit GTPB3, mitochondrial n=1 Tax=Lycorma delicatula TaxID=130591 RepID=UPI003F50F4FB
MILFRYNKLVYFNNVCSRLKRFVPTTFRLLHQYSTIFALSSGFGKCGVAVIRVSGSKTNDVAIKIAGLKEPPEPRKVLLRRFRDPDTKETLDHGLFLYFAGPQSFTGEDCCELQVHGGSAVVSAILSALGKVPGCRPAEPGEFTKRAFYAGKFDLTEVEGLADLISAETEAQRRQALLQMEGVLHYQYTSWRNMLLQCLAHIEAFIDFSEEENIEDNVLDQVNTILTDLTLLIKKHLNDGRRGEKTRNGVKTAIVGAPNVGKSSLFNMLCQQQAAIVSSIPGTTRDIVRMSLDIGGYPITLFDTAGLRNKTEDIIEQEGITRARTTAVDADLILIIIDAYQYIWYKSNKWWKYDNDDFLDDFKEFIISYINTLNLSSLLESCQNVKSELSFILNNGKDRQITDNEDNRHCVIIFNKTDTLDNTDEIIEICEKYKNSVVNISCKTESGFEKLLSLLSYKLKIICGSATKENPALSQERHRYHLLACLSSLERYLKTSENEKLYQIDIMAQHIRKGANELGKVTGSISAEDVLDVVFKQFCIGK